MRRLTAPIKGADCLVVVKYLGELEGDVLLFDGPYSKPQALSVLLDIAEALDFSPKNRICTGHAVAYCGAVQETLELLKNACEWLAGNCDEKTTIGHLPQALRSYTALSGSCASG